jgi:hypothetical protein
LTITPQRSEFAHPAEEAFATILDFYGVVWEYEPRTFDLDWDGDGKVTEAFTPDFYLPDQDLYVEITTLRPKLSSYKNRRIKRMKELYPDVHVKLYKRREVRDMMIKYGLVKDARPIMGDAPQGNLAQHKAAKDNGGD